MSNSLLSRIVSPATLLFAFVIISQTGHGIYLVTEGGPPPAFTVINALGFLWFVGWWLRRDSKARSIPWVYDMGMFLYILWPFIMPYYLLKTRGARGLLVILGFVVAYMGGLVVGVTAAYGRALANAPKGSQRAKRAAEQLGFAKRWLGIGCRPFHEPRLFLSLSSWVYAALHPRRYAVATLRGLRNCQS
ncbi:MAG: hypothetical protein ABJC10_07810 [Acidobacteriota bacterium]